MKLAIFLLLLVIQSRADPAATFSVSIGEGQVSHEGNTSFSVFVPSQAKQNDDDDDDDDASLTQFLSGFSDNRIRPSAVVHCKSGMITAVTISFPQPHALTMPPFDLTMTDESIGEGGEGRFVIDHSNVKPKVSDSAVTFTLHNPKRIPHKMTLKIDVAPRVVTSFEYHFDRVPAEVLSGDLYDVAPTNATMNFKFLLRYDATADCVGIFVRRRSPVPGAVLLISVGGKLEFTEAMENISPLGEGITHAICHAKERSETDVPIHLVVHYFERYRAHHYTATIPNLIELIGNIREQEHSADFVLADVLSVRIERLGSVHDGVSVRLVQHSSTTEEESESDKAAAPAAPLIDNLQISISLKKSGVVFFREEEGHVPTVATDGQPFGWLNALSYKLEDMQRVVDHYGGDAAGRIDVHYDMVEPASNSLTKLVQWMTLHGCTVEDLELNPNQPASHHSRYTLYEKGLAAGRKYSKDDVILRIPVDVLLSNVAAEQDPKVEVVMKNAGLYIAKVEEVLSVSPVTIQHFLIISYFIMLGGRSETINWRRYLETIPTLHPPMPFFFTEDELSLFDFDPSIRQHVRQMRALWGAEYQTIVVNHPDIQRVYTESDYFSLRAHVESRVFNLSTSMVMVPLMDYLNHDDDPNVDVKVEEGRDILFVALRDVEKGESLLIDYGSAKRTKQDFLLQFGFIPVGAQDVAIIPYRPLSEGRDVVDVTLDGNSDSHHVLRRLVLEDVTSSPTHRANAKEDARRVLVKVLNEAKGSLPRFNPRLTASAVRTSHESLKNEVDRIERFAAMLLKSKREILDKHLRWAQEDRD